MGIHLPYPLDGLLPVVGQEDLKAFAGQVGPHKVDQGFVVHDKDAKTAGRRLFACRLTHEGIIGDPSLLRQHGSPTRRTSVNLHRTTVNLLASGSQTVTTSGSGGRIEEMVTVMWCITPC